MLELLGFTFHFLIYKPLLNVLVFLYAYIPGNDFGLAVIGLTLVVRMVLYPVNQAAITTQKKLADLSPKIKQIQERWKNDKERQMKETLALYRETRVNPFASLLPFLVQLPIVFGLFRLFSKKIEQNQFNDLYNFIPVPSELDFTFLNITNLAEPNIIFAVAAGLSQFVQTKMLGGATLTHGQSPSNKSPDLSQMMQKQMLYIFPALTVVILLRVPSALALYWLVTTIFSIGQQYITLNKKKM